MRASVRLLVCRVPATIILIVAGQTGSAHAQHAGGHGMAHAGGFPMQGMTHPFQGPAALNPQMGHSMPNGGVPYLPNGQHPGASGLEHHHHGEAEAYLRTSPFPYGIGGGYWGNGFDLMGMTAEEQQAFKEARLMESWSRTNRENMLAFEAQQRALQAAQQGTKTGNPALRSQPPTSEKKDQALGERNVELKSLIALGQVDWPVRLKPSQGPAFAKQGAAGKALVAVHEQVVERGYADSAKVVEAREKLQLLYNTVKRSRSKPGREQLVRYIRVVDQALDRVPRKPARSGQDD